MSRKVSRKIDIFLPIFIIVVLALATLTIVTFRGIFSTFISAYDVDPTLGDAELRIDSGKLDEAIRAAYEREAVKLNY